MYQTLLKKPSILVTVGLAVVAGAAVVSTSLSPFTADADTSYSAEPLPRPVPASAQHQLASGIDHPLSINECKAQFGWSCYTPVQYREAYNLNPLYREGTTGRGNTIAIVEAFGSPTVQEDLDHFSKQFGIKSTHVDVIKWGPVPRFDADNPDHVGWAGETNLDVQMAHSMAPDAHIVVVETAVAESEGPTGFPEMMDAEKWLIDHNKADVISQSFTTAENTFPGVDDGNFSSIEKLRYAFKDARKHHVTVLAASGDQGPTSYMPDGETLYTKPVGSWPSSDPLVVSVGGTFLQLNDQGKRLAPDSVWNDTGIGAGGGGKSQVFSRPAYQDGVRGIVGSHRGSPDISMSAAALGATWSYTSFKPGNVGWRLTGGTSESTPLFAGVVALADQAAGHKLGDIHQALYQLAEGSSKNRPNGIVDVNDGSDNSFEGVHGFTAAKGYDMATGLGTVDAYRFVKALGDKH